MNTPTPLAIRRGYPVLRLCAAFPIACFTCALLTDGAYGQTANIMWADFSDWLLAVGMAGGVLAAVVGLGSWIAGRRRGEALRGAPIFALGGVVTLAIALLNNFVHSRDAWTSVVPEGLVLSAVTVLVMLVTAWLAARASAPRLDVVTYSGAHP